MKRTFERIAFMLVGALLVGVAYFFGNADQRANAQGISRFENVEITGDLTVAGTGAVSDLMVKNQVAVGDLSAHPRNVIFIKATDSTPGIMLYHNLRDIRTDDADSYVYIIVGESGDSEPIAVIGLRDKLGNHLKGISNSGWSED